METMKELAKAARKKEINETWPERMSKKELRAFIEGCHAMKEYDSYFEAACREFNSRQRYG